MAFPHTMRLTVVAGSLAVALTGAGCVDIVATGPLSYMEREEKRFTTSGRPEVTLATFDGSIEVRPWDRAEVLVVVEKYAPTRSMTSEIEVRSEQNGARITVEARAKRPDHSIVFFGGGRSAKLIVSLPASSDVRATSGDGSIDVERIAGRLELRSGDGSIRGRDLSGDIKAQTGDGSIRLEAINGGLDIGTGDGSIVAAGTLTALRARSGDGSVRIHAEEGSVAEEDWDVYTGDGSVTLDLPARFDAELDAHTDDGHVSAGRLALSNVQDKSRRSVRGKLGAGGRAVRVRTGDGSITLR